MNEPTQSDWETLWKHARGGVYQRWEFLQLQKNLGKKAFFVTIIDNDSLQAGVCLFERTIKTPLGSKKILEGTGTPLFLNESLGKDLLKKIREETRSFFYVTIAPNVFDLEDEFIAGAFDYPSVDNHTILLDLKKNETELWSALEKKSIRWGINTAQKNGLQFIPARSSEEITAFYELYTKTAHDGGFHAEPQQFIEALASTPFSQLFVIKQQENIIAGGLILIDEHHHSAVLDLTAASEEGLKLQAMPFLYWNILLYAKKEGLSSFDLGGFDAEAKHGDKTHNINKFKERFGGNITPQPIFSSNKKYPFLRSAMRKVRVLKKMYSKE